MRRLQLTLVLIVAIGLLMAAEPVTTNLQVSQRTDGSMLVDITYDLADTDSDSLEVTLEVSSDGGQTYDITPSPAALSGDIGEGITPGTGKTIVWDIGAEGIVFNGEQFYFHLSAEDGTPPGMVFVPAGNFMMGDTHGIGGDHELPVHPVNLDAYYIGMYEVTQAQWIEIMGSIPLSTYGVDDSYPVYCVSSFAVMKYCNRRSITEGLEPAYSVGGSTDPSVWGPVPTSYNETWNAAICDRAADGYRLPTQAEWEYAARGATNDPDNIYSGSDTIGDVAWWSGNSAPGGVKTVGTKDPNGIGIYDMTGNVWEWCWDWWSSTYYQECYNQGSVTNPCESTGDVRVGVGGCWASGESTSRVTHFGSGQPYGGPPGMGDYGGAGFRVARSAPGWGENNAPEQPSNPTPADDAMSVELTPTLQWSCSDADGDALTYNVYFGTSEDLTEADIVATAISDTFFTTSELEEGTTYYWKVVASDGTWINVSPVWSFTTIDYPDMVLVPAGTFQMGRTDVAEPVHTVNLDSFYIGTNEVTHQEVIDVYNWAYQQEYINCSSTAVINAIGSQQEQFLTLDNEDSTIDWNGSQLVFSSGAYATDPQCPCIVISWYGAAAYCNYLSIQEGLTPCYDLTTWSCNWDGDGYRLPTEAEWEYAARGATNVPDYLYAGSDNIGNTAWYYSNSDFYTHQVGLKNLNGIGTRDQSGNVWEWCWDRYGDYSSGAQTNPTGAQTGDYRILRGGSFSNEPEFCEVAYRYYIYQSGADGVVGFRLARNAE